MNERSKGPAAAEPPNTKAWLRNEMKHTEWNGEPMQPHSESTVAWVHEILEPDQLSTAKLRFGRRGLSPGTLVILWVLRAYVVLMVLLIGVQIWNALHGGV
jgi:hypothetical protein